MFPLSGHLHVRTTLARNLNINRSVQSFLAEICPLIPFGLSCPPAPLNLVFSVTMFCLIKRVEYYLTSESHLESTDHRPGGYSMDVNPPNLGSAFVDVVFVTVRRPKERPSQSLM